jgi:hypothetical protein
VSDRFRFGLAENLCQIRVLKSFAVNKKYSFSLFFFFCMDSSASETGKWGSAAEHRQISQHHVRIITTITVSAFS